MSQNVVNYGIDPSGTQLLDDLLSGEQQNRLTMDGGNSRPSYAEIGTIWTDKSVTGKATLKRFNGTSDDILMTIDETTGAITIPGIADTDLSNLSASGNSKFQEPLVSGTNIKTVNNETLLGSGNISISAGANVDLSNLSATGNDKFVTKDTAQTITGVKKFSTISGLQAKDPLLLKENNTNEGGQINFQRSDNSVLTSDPYIDLIINTMRVVGVSSQNALHVALQIDLENNKVLVPSPAATDNDYQAATTAWVNDHRCTTAATTTSSASIYKPAIVIENYRNGNQWYRKWSDGWIEQGGYKSQATPNTITLNKAFTTTDYTILALCDRMDASVVPAVAAYRNNSNYPKSTTAFTLTGNTSSLGQYWYACGY